MHKIKSHKQERIMSHFSWPTKECQACHFKGREKEIGVGFLEQGAHFCHSLFKNPMSPHSVHTHTHMLVPQFTFITCTAGEQWGLPHTLYRTDWQLGLKTDRYKLLIKGYKSTATGILWCLQAEGSSKVLHKCNNIYKPRQMLFTWK